MTFIDQYVKGCAICQQMKVNTHPTKLRCNTGMGNTMIILSRVWSGTGRGSESSYLPKTVPIPAGFTGIYGIYYVVVL